MTNMNKSVEDSWEQGYKDIRTKDPFVWPDVDLIRLVSHLSLPDRPKILDFGCGEGRNTRFLIEKFNDGQFLCVDKSESALQILNALYGDLVDSRRLSNEFELEGTCQYDLIICWGVCHYLDDPEAFLRKLRLLMKSSGYLVISLKGETDARPQMAESLHCWTEVSAENLIERCGFRITESGSSLGVRRFPAKASWHNYWFAVTSAKEI